LHSAYAYTNAARCWNGNPVIERRSNLKKGGYYGTG
jgi:hypothetical protein